MQKISNKKSKINNRQQLDVTAQLYIALAIFVVSVVLSRSADMTNWEIWLFGLIYNNPEILKSLFFVITQIGSMHMLGIALIILLIKKRYDAIARLLSASLLAYLMAGFSKDIWGRARPDEVLPGVVNLDYMVRGPGFPSGHTALATALILVLLTYLPPKFRLLGYMVIALVAYSRVYLGIHAPLDILGGFAIGYACYALVMHLRITLLSNILKRS